MGVRIYSKLKCKHYPNLDLVAARAKEAYDSLMGDPFTDLYYNFDMK